VLPGLRSGCCCVFADAADMRRVVTRFRCLVARWIVVAFVEAKVLWFLGGRFWALDDNGLDRFSQEFGVVNVGPGDGRP